jgi:SAM-dependent methyltransferase
MEADAMSRARREHWDEVYGRVDPAEVSWYQSTPQMSLDLIAATAVPPTDAIVDIGGGTSNLATRLVGRGFADVSVLDVSARAAQRARDLAGDAAARVDWIVADVLSWRPSRRYRLWHDRAVFHFFTDEVDREAYAATLGAALDPEGLVIVATFALDGPEQCSGLPTARYDGPSLAAALGDRFELVDSRREEHHTPGGAMQPFTWVVLRHRAPAHGS